MSERTFGTNAGENGLSQLDESIRTRSNSPQRVLDQKSSPKKENERPEMKEVPFDDYKVFNDPVHGHIALHPLLVKIIDTPQFQRLRNIKQLGGNYFVYPGASHNRFEHSIGVAYLAEKLVRMLQQRQKELEISKEDILCVAIAGLCHDLGHGPFSHLFDGMFLPQVLPQRKWKHEDGSCEMLDHLIEENGLKQDFEKYCLTDNDVTFIREMIAGPKSAENKVVTPSKKSDGEWNYKGRDSTKRFLYEIVSNERNKMDVDKWDYFARDCHHLGIRNSFDHNRFMQFMKVLESDDGQLQLCARDKELVNLYEMFHTRSILHQRAYQHKTSVAIELMITKALVKANKHVKILGTGGKTCSVSECIDDLVAYTKLNDNIFYQILHSEVNHPEMDEARKLLNRVQKRNLFICIGGIPLQSDKKEEVTVTAEDIISLDNTLQDGDIIVWRTKIDHGKGEDNPVKNFSFFRKSDKDQAFLIPETEISKIFLPQQFQEKSCLVWYTSDDDKKIAAAKHCWNVWTEKHPEVTTLDITWSPPRKPIRKERGGKSADSAENSKAKKKLF